MSQALDMSLDDIIRNNKKSGGSNGNFRGRGRGRGFVSGPGPARRFPNRAPTRTTPYLIPQQMLAMGGSGSESATKLYVSNLDYGVSNDDLKVLFSEVGEVKRHSIHYDRSGRSKGTAEVVFTRQSDALTAVERYNNVQLDGKPMKIELVGVNIVTPPAPPTTNGILGNPSGNFRRQERVAGRGWDRRGGGGGGRGFGRGRGRGRGHGEKVSAEALDADLEKYHIEAMQIN
ncbi:THO complex subunit 4A-like isoform X2 [Camellia sinensis]|uniref:THO complex subunit 4A-like isoform X2 n=1 Tax=Camellia sinensis TaxID=4442 RepID=UPI001036473A|nr:THO complex subunit 4A-like isoform X2 [Camellia sinensis]